LRIEQGRGRTAAGRERKIQLLARGVGYRRVIAGRERLPELRKLARAVWINNREIVFSGYLDEAQLGPECVFRYKFGVNADAFSAREAPAEFGQLRR
jgi:hypothetical protein